MFIPRAQLHAHSLFLFPIVFGINLIHFSNEKKSGAAGNSIVCHSIGQKQNEEWELFRRVQRFGNGKCELSAILDGAGGGGGGGGGKMSPPPPPVGIVHSLV